MSKQSEIKPGKRPDAPFPAGPPAAKGETPSGPGKPKYGPTKPGDPFGDVDWNKANQPTPGSAHGIP